MRSRIGWPLSLPLPRALAPARARWAALPARDRLWLVAGAWVLGAFLVWTLAVRPALASRARAQAERPALEAQLQTMRRLAAEARELRAVGPAASGQAAAALQAATDRLGPSGRLTLQGERAVLTLNGASTSQLRDWLAEARSGARARPVEASLARAPNGYSGTLIVAFAQAVAATPGVAR